MGMNYYIKPKEGFDKINKLNDDLDEVLKSISETYINEINTIIDNNDSEINKQYFKTSKINEENFYILPRFKIEDPSVHLCKMSAGWRPAFEKSSNYTNFDELHYFLLYYKDSVKIVDEYDRELSQEEFEEEVIKHKNNPNNHRSHLQFNNLYTFYTKDSTMENIEWTTSSFS